MRTLHLLLKVWRQSDAAHSGSFVDYQTGPISPDLSFLEMLDQVNEQLTLAGDEPIAFDNDCREGICGACGTYVNGVAHGPDKKTTLCQLHMRHFNDGDTIVIEPFRARAFPLIKDLVVDRSALDTIIQAGGYISTNIGSAPDANSIPVPQHVAEEALDAAECIGCGACIAACPNASAMLFVGGKISQLALLPQGGPERKKRALSMVRAMDDAGFGACGNERECENVCPKGLSIKNIARCNREFIRASLW